MPALDPLWVGLHPLLLRHRHPLGVQEPPQQIVGQRPRTSHLARQRLARDTCVLVPLGEVLGHNRLDTVGDVPRAERFALG